MAKKSAELKKRNWIDRMIYIYQNLELNTLYSPPGVREFLRNNFNDSISHKTVRRLLEKMIEAQKKGLKFKINDKTRKLISPKTSSRGVLYQLIEED